MAAMPAYNVKILSSPEPKCGCGFYNECLTSDPRLTFDLLYNRVKWPPVSECIYMGKNLEKMKDDFSIPV